MIKMIAFDLDGTALNSQKVLSPRTGAAIARAIEQGMAAVPCTGREIGNIPVEILTIPGMPYLVANNGAQVCTLPEREIVYTRALEPDVALSVLRECRAFKGLIFASTGIAAVVDRKGHVWEDELAGKMLLECLKGLCIPMADLEESIERGEGQIYKFDIIFFDDEEFERAQNRFSGRADVGLSSSRELNLEIMPPGASKADALEYVCTRLNMDMSHVMAVGDNGNDIEMITEAGYGVAMGNSVEALRERADHVTLSCDEDGLAVVIEEVLDRLP